MKLRDVDIFKEREYHIAETVLAERKRTFLHDHEFYEIFLITEGTVYHHLNGEDRVVGRGNLCFIRPEDEHQFSRCGKETARFVNVAFPAYMYDAGARAAAVSLGLPAGEMPEFLGEAEISEAMVQLLLRKTELLTALREDRDSLLPHAMMVNYLADALTLLYCGEAQREIPGWLRDALQHMRETENYAAGIERFVEISGRSREHLSRSVKRYYGKTPSELINRIRLEAAADRLKSTDEPVLQIMMQCGFNNSSYFNKLFRDTYGKSPREYRKWNHGVVDPGVL